MFEDSISCSPGNDKKSSGSRSRRFHKKTKRQSQRLSTARPAENVCTGDVPCLEALYDESEHIITQYEPFNPFENEIILAAADIAVDTTYRSKLNRTSQGFVRLENLPVSIDNEEDNVPLEYLAQPQSSVSVPKSTVQAICGPETQFGITESELLRFCDEVEIEADSQPTTETKTPKITKSIVDSILEDFCGSPYSESPPKFIADDDTPIFRFKSKSLRTYSGLRRRKPRRNIVTELASVPFPDDDGNASDSSGLSIQEGLSQTIVPQLDTVDLNNSIRICENLLNLSSYFSQIASHEKSSTASEENEEYPIPAIVEDIIKLRRKPFTITRSKSQEEFYGFSDGGGSASCEDTWKDLLEEEDDVLQQISCDSLCYEVVPKVSFEYKCSDVDTAVKGVNDVIEDANKLILSRSEPSTEGKKLSSGSLQNCDKHKDILQNSSALGDEHLLDDIDFWDEDECLLNYKTQKPHSNPRKLADCERNLDLIDGTSLNIDLEKGKQIQKVPTNMHISYKCKDEIDYRSSTSTKQKVVDIVKNPLEATFKKPIGNLTNPSFLGFSTASRKPIAISEDAKRKAAAILTKFEQEEIEQRMAAGADVPMIGDNSEEMNTKGQEQKVIPTRHIIPKLIEETSLNIPLEGFRYAEKPIDKTPASTFLGFSTASRKPVAISDEAKRKADNILKKFEQEELEKEITPEVKYIDDIPISDDLQRFSCSGNNSTSTFVGFTTASKKPISVSDTSKRKADEFLRNFEKVEKEARLQESRDLATTSGKIRKLDEVSEEVKQKAQELLKDIEFFEEAFEEELKTVEKHSIHEASTIKTFRVDCNEESTSTWSCLGKPECNNPVSYGFKTASEKSIQISEGAKIHADQLFRKVENEDLPQDFLKCIQADLNDVNLSHAPDRSIGREEQVDGASKDPTQCVQMMLKVEKNYLHVNKSSVSDLNGLNSAYKKSVKCTEEISAERLLRKVNKKDLDIVELDDDFNQPNPAFARLHEIDEEFHDGTKSYSQDYEMTETLKRKRNAFYAEDLRKSPPLISPRRLSCTERAPLNRIENVVLHKTSSLPLIQSASKPSLISRKNLLSLSKRKKFNSPGRIDDGCTGPKTPDKIQHPAIPQDNANATPNLKEFFNSVSTSTPRLIRNGESKSDMPLLNNCSIDIDFRQINWEDANNSGRVCKTSSFTDPNVTCTEASPTPKQRIERLKMYGEPPPISPILMVNQCRPAGLRRGRSLMKP